VSPAPTVATPVAPGIEPDIAAKTPAVTPPPENTAALSPAAPARAPNPRPNGFSTIEGNALRATGLGIRGVAVRLRDARFGRIVDTQTSGESGVFAFRSIDPGVYIVEVVGDDQHVLAASQLLNVTAGDTLSTSVRLPFRVAGAGLFDSKGMAAIVAAEAAAAGILTTTTTNPVSPTQ
jgi:hypothetical protein